MNSIILLGIATLSSLTNSQSTIDYNELSCETKKSVLYLEESDNLIYSIDGSARNKVEESYNKRILIDRLYNKEIYCWNLNEYPYKNHEKDFKVYFRNGKESLFCYFDGKDFINLNNYSKISNELIANSIEDNSNPGSYYKFTSYGSDAKIIDNAYYFEKLGDNHSLNNDGTCTIVASEILLSYFDLFYNDSIVDEKYEVKVKESINTNNTRDFIHAPGLGKKYLNKEFKNFYIDFVKEKTGDDASLGNGISILNIIKSFQKYLDEQGITHYDNYCEGNWWDAIKKRNIEEVKMIIDDNRPAYVCGSGHATVAYEYDDKYVYVHTGWGYVAKTSWDTIDDLYKDSSSKLYENGCFSTDVAGLHVHSDSYINTKTGKTICPCGYIK